MNISSIPFLSHVYIGQIGLHITFNGCSFINEKFPETVLTHGILTFNAGIKVLKSENGNSSLFSNLTYGIRMEGGVELRETFIKNSVFRGNYCGIFTNNTLDLTLMDNKFYLVARLGFVYNVPTTFFQPVSPQAIGIAVESTYRTRIEDNEFYGISNPSALNTVGLLVKNNPYYLYTIERNYFLTLSYGSQAIGANLNSDNPTYSGILYGCNIFEGCVRGISIAEDSTNIFNNGIKPVQDRLNYYIYNVVDVENTTNTPVVFYFDNTNNMTLPTISGLVGLQDTVYSSDFCATNSYGLTSESVLLTQQKTLNSLNVTSDKDIVVLDNKDDEELLSLLENGNDQEKIVAKGLLYFRGVKTDHHPYIVTSMTDDTVQNKSFKIFKSDIDERNIIRIAPNPAREEVNISSDEMITKIELINSLGNIVYSKNLSNNYVRIDLSCFSKGNYLVKIALNNRVEIRKLGLMVKK
ncbi:MAG: T9SS type A sorting domain-containing protein [Bacteroidales bacterium]|nr:T9SS type A sorting domain-containing protein [Bacteroidales bacterium]